MSRSQTGISCTSYGTHSPTDGLFSYESGHGNTLIGSTSSFDICYLHWCVIGHVCYVDQGQMLFFTSWARRCHLGLTRAVFAMRRWKKLSVKSGKCVVWNNKLFLRPDSDQLSQERDLQTASQETWCLKSVAHIICFSQVVSGVFFMGKKMTGQIEPGCTRNPGWYREKTCWVACKTVTMVGYLQLCKITFAWISFTKVLFFPVLMPLFTFLLEILRAVLGSFDCKQVRFSSFEKVNICVHQSQ